MRRKERNTLTSRNGLENEIDKANNVNLISAINTSEPKKSWKKIFKKSDKTSTASHEENYQKKKPLPKSSTNLKPTKENASTKENHPNTEVEKRNYCSLTKIDSVETTDQSTTDQTFETPSISSATAESDAIHGASKKKSDRSKSRAILSRPFSRTSIPKGNGWVVEVSPAEWDADQSRWKYRILVQRRQLNNPSNKDTPSSFTTAFTWRSLADFAWLEEALRAEFHGALILPLLSIAVGTPDLANTQYEIDAHLLKDWLGDVLNGIRGQGELLLNQKSVGLISSEALEAFLYRNTDPLHNVSGSQHPRDNSTIQAASSLDLPWKDSPEKDTRESSFVDSLWSKPFQKCSLFDNICNGACVTPETKESIKSARLDLMRANCSSRALGDTATLEIQDSFVEYEPTELDSSNFAIHSELLEAERELVEFNRKSCLASMERLRQLKEEESQVAGAWKRFAISLSNLYSYEKEVENSKVCAKKENQENMPYRKLDKNTVDELLRVMARQKFDRSVSSLNVMDVMLGAYVADLTAVGPSLKAYSEAVAQLANLDDSPPMGQKQATRGVENSWSDPFKSLMSFVEVKKESSERPLHTVSSTADSEIMTERFAFEKRVLANERLLCDSLRRLCKATSIRTARIAYNYFKSEQTQTTLLSSSAISLRTKINLSDHQILDMIRERHRIESERDNKTEAELVHRLINIGNANKFDKNQSSRDQRKPNGNGTSADQGEIRMALKEKALRMAEQCVGKWDSNLALAIMEAVGIADAEVQVEETTRDLRLVRRHAIGLRENLSRCAEALEVLRSMILNGYHESAENVPLDGAQSILKSRSEFVTKFSIVFSGALGSQGNGGKPKSTRPSLKILEKAGIPVDDPAGWLTEASRGKSGGRCGVHTEAYFNSRDSSVEELLDKLEAELKDYKKRVESIESYVYMQCVGIQLEKNFSKKRAEALAAFEKKTDIQTAINIAKRKKLPVLVQELNAKMDDVLPAGVTHTSVKEAKEAHLMSKTLKAEIGELALRRFQRNKERAMNRIVSIMSCWATCKSQLILFEKL
mmetsp:Transcript_3186/g.4725  ORF Transcript_3186/g.4725 Transcript_3186/m.4725 type:complete len:1048 (+) Transcript_3186:434-3577(+)